MAKGSGNTRNSSSGAPQGFRRGEFIQNSEASALQYTEMRTQLFNKARESGWNTRISDVIKEFDESDPVYSVRVNVEFTGNGEGATKNYYRISVGSSIIATAKAPLGSKENSDYNRERSRMERDFENKEFTDAKKAMDYAEKQVRAFNRKWK